MAFKPYITPLTVADRDAYIAHCKSIGKEATFGRWVASLTQAMNNDNTNRLRADASLLWEGTGLRAYPPGRWGAWRQPLLFAHSDYPMTVDEDGNGRDFTWCVRNDEGDVVHPGPMTEEQADALVLSCTMGPLTEEQANALVKGARS
jgi:hypothetical protein